MNCRFCGQVDTKVTDSRPAADGIRRRRECQACGQRFTTVERAELGGVSLVKKDGRGEVFDRGKIIAGVRKACEKRPIPSGAIEALADDVEKAALSLNKPEIPSNVVGEMVMERLRALDHIAYIRFPSTEPSPTLMNWSESWPPSVPAGSAATSHRISSSLCLRSCRAPPRLPASALAAHARTRTHRW